MLNPTVDAEAAVFCVVGSIVGVQNNSQNKAVICIKGTGCPGCSEGMRQPDDIVALPVKNASPSEHWVALAPPTVLEVVVLNWLLCCCKAASRLQALFSMQCVTSVVTDMDLKPRLVS